MDQYLDDEKCYQRLLKEYLKYGSLVVAYDFDNTVYDFHKEGNTYNLVIKLLQNLKEIGCHLICFTANEDIDFITTYLTDKKIPFNSINKDPEFFPTKSRKLYYNVLLDDRAGLFQVYKQLTRLIQEIRK